MEKNTETVTVTWGEEKYSPGGGSYSSFTVGPFWRSSALRDGETHEQAEQRVMKGLEEMARKAFERKLKAFKQALSEVQSSFR